MPSLSILLHHGDMPDARADKTPPRSAYGQYELLYDEEIEKDKQTNKQKHSNSARSRGPHSKPSSWK